MFARIWARWKRYYLRREIKYRRDTIKILYERWNAEQDRISEAERELKGIQA